MKEMNRAQFLVTLITRTCRDTGCFSRVLYCCMTIIEPCVLYGLVRILPFLLCQGTQVSTDVKYHALVIRSTTSLNNINHGCIFRVIKSFHLLKAILAGESIDSARVNHSVNHNHPNPNIYNRSLAGNVAGKKVNKLNCKISFSCQRVHNASTGQTQTKSLEQNGQNSKDLNIIQAPNRYHGHFVYFCTLHRKHCIQYLIISTDMVISTNSALC